MDKLSIVCWLCTALCLGLLTSVAGCEALSGAPALEWPGPHAPYPFPDDVPHRTS
ncbi:hypothetical protein [Paraburkholderia hospita]|jgi:hypothetical protein|uniref:hypothetical protein n=1 Tax=Paraburkholderia hospita TaxID=169430 RepID=UPI0008A7BDD2|nr:hypothetical protein [Paraburkholderia hospita]SEI26031.1 hypothetical protein SAMN05192544_106517 [Paraburkholderia hospita]